MTPAEIEASRKDAAEAFRLGFIGETTLGDCEKFLDVGGRARVNADDFFLKLARLDRVQLGLVRKDPAILNGLRPFNARLRVLREISRGGMGVVYQAWDSELDRVVAIKEILPERLEGPTSLKLLQRFKNESRAMASISHPAVVGVYEAGLSPQGSPYLVIDYVPGASLKVAIARLKEGATLEEVLAPRPPEQPVDAPGPTLLPIAQVTGWGIALAEGLQACHSRRVIHRDVKPANVLISERGEAKLTDFGVALDSVGERVTKTGEAVGTPLYMPPESLLGKRDGFQAEPTLDIYSLGATLFEALTGEPPFQGKTVREFYLNVYEGKPTRPRALRPEITPDLEEVLLKCLRPAPGERYASAADLAEDLRRAERDEPTLARAEFGAPTRVLRGRLVWLLAFLGVGLGGLALLFAWRWA